MVIKVDRDKCCYCGGCVSICEYDAITLKEAFLEIDKNKCAECGLCLNVCPVGAIYKLNKEGV